MLDFIRLIIFWDDYLSKNHVKAIIGVHAQYSYGIVHRLSVYKNIICLLHVEGRIYKITRKNLFQHNEFKFYKEKFENYQKNIKKMPLRLEKN